MFTFYCNFWQHQVFNMAPLFVLTEKNNSSSGKITPTPHHLRVFNLVKKHVTPTMSTLGLPWEEISIDTIGPWKIDITNYGTVVFNGFTVINTTT